MFTVDVKQQCNNKNLPQFLAIHLKLCIAITDMSVLKMCTCYFAKKNGGRIGDEGNKETDKRNTNKYLKFHAHLS